MHTLTHTLETAIDARFQPLSAFVNRTRRVIDGSAAALFVIQRDKVVAEAYFGTHDHHPLARELQADSQFNIYSARKSYIGLAVAMALYEGKIGSLDDEVSHYFPEIDAAILAGTTIRHLLTHTHGLDGNLENIIRVAPAGTRWAYVGVGIELLCELVKRTTGHTVGHLIRERVIAPLQLQETGWRTVADDRSKLVPDVIYPDNEPFLRFDTDEGNERNLYVSARDLATWGYLHLKKGQFNGVQLLPPELFAMTTTLQSPVQEDLLQNGFLWHMNENKHPRSELGEDLPAGSYQILGVTGCACLVIPALDAVVVHMQNHRGNPPGYDYLRDIKDFGNLAIGCLTRS